MLSEHAINLENAIIATLAGDRLPTEAEINLLASELRGISIYRVDDTECELVLRRIHARLQIDMDTGTAIAEKYKPWLSARKPSIDPFYWNRFDVYLKRNGWPPRVVAKLGQVTDDILDLLGDPAKPGTWERRGLVMGDVQSGKTVTYTALASKAADAGYRLIIVLTGTLENLRRQTQERLDLGFVGLDSSGWLVTRERRRSEVGVGEIDKRRMAAVFTSRTKDFNIGLVNQLNLRIRDMAEPILLVVKKHKQILENLGNWLRTYNSDSAGFIDSPLLLIDDEADNASINTSSDNANPTAINERIRSLLHLFSRKNYVGFTATPFANIFIDPDNDDEMRGSDLFPRDFIYSLEKPTNYFGSQEIFGDNPTLNCLRTISDAEAFFPSGHKSSFAVSELPPSLFQALRSFILANAVRDISGDETSHRSMLVNVSRFTAVQDQVTVLLEDALRQVQESVRNYSKLPVNEALRNKTISELRQSWDEEFGNIGITWEEVQEALQGAALPIVVRSVNQRTGAASLDFSSHSPNGLRLIAVGGNSLSRGLTLEGLCTSYFFRNTQMYDTLLQMGRWFGYRDGYANLCRVWLTDDAIHWYSHISAATEELREQIKQMRAAGLTPKDFGLAVRSHPDSLIVTARNKMRTSREIERIISVSGEGMETAQLSSDTETIRANADAAKAFIKVLENRGIQPKASDFGNVIWQDVPKECIVTFLRRFISHQLDFVFRQDFLASFVENTSEEKLSFWDVVVPNGEGGACTFGSLSYLQQLRTVVLNHRTKSILVSGKSRRVGGRGIEKEGLSKVQADEIGKTYRNAHPGKSVPDKEYRLKRTRPLLLVHLVTPRRDGKVFDSYGVPLVALGLSFPPFGDHSEGKRIKYKINLVECRNLFELESDDDIEVEDEPV